MLEPEAATCDIGHRTPDTARRRLRRSLLGCSNGHVDPERRTAISERRDRVEQELTAAVGGGSLCSISRSAGPVPGVKYLEGRMAALMELERAGRRGENLANVTAEAHSRWSERLSGAQERGMSVDWTAYYAGGVDELAEFSAVDPDLPQSSTSPSAE